MRLILTIACLLVCETIQTAKAEEKNAGTVRWTTIFMYDKAFTGKYLMYNDAKPNQKWFVTSTAGIFCDPFSSQPNTICFMDGGITRSAVIEVTNSGKAVFFRHPIARECYEIYQAIPITNPKKHPLLTGVKAEEITGQVYKITRTDLVLGLPQGEGCPWNKK